MSTKVAAALVVAAFAAVALGLAMAFLPGGLSPLTASLPLLGGAAVGVLAFRGMPPDETIPVRVHPVEWLLIGVFACTGLRAFLWLLYPKDGQLCILSPNNLGDISLHLDFIRYLSSGVPFWPDSPILTGEPLKYPPGTDFLNGLFLAAGLPLEQGLVWAGLTGTALTGLALWRWGRGFALAAFLFGGGLAGFGWLQQAIASGNFSLQDVQGTGTWKNLFLALFVTQRGLLLALPAGLFLLDHWRDRYLRGGRGHLPGWAALLLYATMPLYNVHAFLFLSAMLVGMFAFAADATTRRASVIFGAAAFLPAALCAGLVTGGFASGGGIHWQPGWLQDSEKGVGPVWFWFRNFGVYLLLWIALLVIADLRRSREVLGVALPATAMFVLCAFVSFAVWPWDNTKILLWSWLAVAPGIWTVVIRPLVLPLRIVLCIALFFTGAVSLVAGLDGRHGYGLVDASLVNATASAVQPINPRARFASAPEFSHPLIILGRKVALGYDGHLWSHGLNYQGKMEQLKNLMLGGPGWEANAHQLGVDYLFWGPQEAARYPGSTRPWAAQWPIIARNGKFTIFRAPGARW